MEKFLCRTVFLITLAMAIPFMSHARGQQEDVLARADEYIANKQYTEALEILTPFARQNSRNFEAAQRRIRHIIGVKDEYNATAQRLLDEMDKDELDDELILVLTNRLFELDPQRGAETREFLQHTYQVALFRSNMRRLERILTEGPRLVEQGNYNQALRLYIDGLTIYQDEFFSGIYGSVIENRARQGINTLTTNTTAAITAANALKDAVNALAALSGQGVEAANLVAFRNAYNRVTTEMERFMAMRSNFAAVNTIFKDDLDQLRRNNPRLGDRNFLAFAVR